MSKKLITSFVALSLVLAMVVPGVNVKAQTITEGSLVKVAGSDTVYLIQGGKKLAFPYLSVYRSWGYPDDFSTVQTVSQEVLNSYPDGGYVCFRPGSLFRGTGRSVYPEYEARAVFYVTTDCQLRPVRSAGVYKRLFGDPTFRNTWWVPDDFLPRFTYPLASRIESDAVLPDGLFGRLSDGRYVLITNNGTQYRVVTEDGIRANRFVTARAANIASLSGLTEGTPITGVESALVTVRSMTPTVTTALTVSLAEDTPIATNVPITAQNVPYTKIKIINGNSPVTISSITVKRTGLGAATDFAKIGLFEGEVQVGSYKTLSSATDSAVFTFSSPVSLEANQVKYYTIKASLNSGTEGHVNKLGVSAITTSATVSGLPVYGNFMTAVNIGIGGVTVTDGSLSNNQPKIGEDNVELAVIRFNATSTEDIELHSFKLRQTGTARASDLANLAVYQSGSKVGDCSLVNDYLTCVLSTPFEIKKNATKEFKVLGDIESGYGRTVIFDLEEVYDVNAVGKSYGFPVPVDKTRFTPQTVTITAGAVAINFNGPDASDITQGQKDINLANLEITSNNEDAELRTFYVGIRVNGNINANSISANYLENVELYDPETGGIFDGTAISTAGHSYQYYWKFSPYVTLTKGVKKTYQIRFDTPLNKPNDGTTFAAYLPAAGMTIRGLTSNQDITDISPSTLEGKLMTVKAPGLKVTPVSLVDETIVAGKRGVPLYKAILEASGETIKVTEIKFSEHTANYFTDANVDHVYLYKVSGSTETLIKELTEAQFSGTYAIFSGLNLLVPPGSANAVTIVLKVDVATNASGHLGVEITHPTNDILAEDADGDNVDETGIFAGVNGRTVTIATQGALSADMDTSVAEVNKDRYTVANAETAWLGRIKLDATYEDVRITKIILTNTTSTGNDPSDSVNWLKLYKSDKTTEVATAYWTEGSSDITFDLNYVVDDVGVDYLYLKASLKKIGIGADDTADSNDEIRLRVSDITAYGVDTGKSITPTIGTTYTKSTIISAAKLAAVENALADGNLGSGSRVIAKFKITAGPTTNADNTGDTVQLLIKQLKITFNGNVSATSVTIEREGGIDGVANVTSTDVVGATQPIDIDLESLLPNDYKIESNTSATYVIKATISYSGSGTKWIQTKIDGLNTGSDVVKWSDEYNDFSTSRLDYNSVDGAYLSINL